MGAALGNAPQGRLLEKELEEVGVDHRATARRKESGSFSRSHTSVVALEGMGTGKYPACQIHPRVVTLTQV